MPTAAIAATVAGVTAVGAVGLGRREMRVNSLRRAVVAVAALAGVVATTGAQAGPPTKPAEATVADLGVSSDGRGNYVHRPGSSVVFDDGISESHDDRFSMTLWGGSDRELSVAYPTALSRMTCVDSTFIVAGPGDWYGSRAQAVGAATLICYGPPSSGLTYRFRWGQGCVEINPTSASPAAFEFTTLTCTATVEKHERGQFRPAEPAVASIDFDVSARTL